jgi:hypothetical protein
MRNDLHGGYGEDVEFQDPRIYWRTELFVVSMATAILEPRINLDLRLISNHHRTSLRGSVGFVLLSGETIPPNQRSPSRNREERQSSKNLRESRGDGRARGFAAIGAQ